MFIVFNFFFLFNKNNKLFINLINLINNMTPASSIKNFKKILMINILLFMMLNFNSLFFNFICFLNNFSFNLILALIFYLSIFFYFPFKIINLFIHFSMKKIPLALMSFLILIEFLSFFIKPTTLIIRLSTNLMTGHLILELISSLLFFWILFLILL